MKKILVLGSIVGQTKQRVRALRALGYEVVTLSETVENFAPGINYKPSFMDRVRHKLGLPEDKLKINNKIVELCKQQQFDLLWVEKALTLKPATLKKIKQACPNMKLAWYSGDDMSARHNQSFYFRKSLPLYDVVFTTKSYNCNQNELPALGARKVVFSNKSFDQFMHAPIEVTEEDRKRLGGDVGFIGTFEHDRAEKMLFLAQNGVHVRVWGNGWGSYMNIHPNLIVENKPIYDENYRKGICATKINLCFLRKLNRDLQTDRTMEIPACGAFMLAERTNEHLQLFVEDKEAVFFDVNNPQELLEKVNYYLQHEEEREQIAKAGRERCFASDYSHEQALKNMLQELEKA